MRQIYIVNATQVVTSETHPEGAEIAKHKRFTFDIVETPVDPLR